MKTKKKKILLSLLALLIIGGAGTGYILYTNAQSSSDKPRPINDVDYGGPTKEEQQAGDKIKDTLPDNKGQDSKNTAQTSTKQKASVIITDANQYDDTVEVRAFIPDYYQDGTCTISFSKTGQPTITKETPAYKDASTTICTNPLIKRSEFSTGGQWSVTVSYMSTNAQGTSIPQKLTLK